MKHFPGVIFYVVPLRKVIIKVSFKTGTWDRA